MCDEATDVAQGYAFQMEIIVRARKLGFSIAEVWACPSP